MDNHQEINNFEDSLRQILANEQLAGADDIVTKASTLLVNDLQKEKKT